MRLESPAFADGERIPKKYTEDGQNLSPPLRWSDVPEGTRAFALICDDPDAPRTEPWVHWVMYDIPPDVRSLPEGIDRSDHPKHVPTAAQGHNSWPHNNIGYRGPAPPHGHGTHHYHFKLFALDTRLNLEPGIAKEALLSAMKGHVLAEAELVGTYER